jgi:hypothetical protein
LSKNLIDAKNSKKKSSERKRRLKMLRREEKIEELPSERGSG